MGKHNVLMWWKTSTFFSIWFKSFLSPSAKEVCEGYVFTRVCYSVHRDGLQAIPTGEVGWSGWGVFRPRPKGVYRPREVSRATPLGVQAQAGGVYPSMHWSRHPPREMATAAAGMHPTGIYSCSTHSFKQFAKMILQWSSQAFAGPKGGTRDMPPWGSKFFHFHAVFSKNFKNNSNFGSWRTPSGKS